MKQRTFWSLIFTTSNPQSKSHQFRINKAAVFILLTLCFTGFIGFIRLTGFMTSYTISKFLVFEAKRENEVLQSRVAFTNHFIQNQAQQIQTLVTFEDDERLKYGMTKISSDVRSAGIGGKPDLEELMIASIMDPVVMRVEAVRESLSVLVRKVTLQKATFSDMTSRVVWLQRRWAQRPTIWPTNGKVTSPFGYRMHPIEGTELFHEGLDIANKVSTPVYATAEGIVRENTYRDDFGNIIILDHPGTGFLTYYAHLEKMVVHHGQHVKRGDLIGFMGTTGRSTGPHLHYEVHEQGKPINPAGFILPSDIVVD